MSAPGPAAGALGSSRSYWRLRSPVERGHPGIRAAALQQRHTAGQFSRRLYRLPLHTGARTPMATKVHPALAAIRKSGAAKVKVACSDIDGILRGKYLHKDKFECRGRQRLRLLRRGVRLGLRRHHLRQRPGHRLAARLSRRAGAAGPEHPSPGALGRRRRFLPRRVRQCRRQPLRRSARARP